MKARDGGAAVAEGGGRRRRRRRRRRVTWRRVGVGAIFYLNLSS
jgi:hypothetical protein